MHSLLIILFCLMAILCSAGNSTEPALPPEEDAVFNLKAIREDLLDAVIKKSVESDGIITEEIEYTGEIHDGKPLRVFGILAYPKGGQKLPAIFWSQGGMAPADTFWPVFFAKKGYFCLNVTLPIPLPRDDVFGRFRTEDPRNGNLSRLAAIQMRGITYLTQRAEVNPEQLGIAGTSYGSLFATLIAGADSRVKAAAGFFCCGHHELGSGFPQFTNLRNSQEMERWSRTIDPSFRLRKRTVPIIWGLASNDMFQHLPAAVQTYRDAGGEKRIAIAPNWGHALPENFDKTILDWFDIYLTGRRAPYNKPSMLKLENKDGRLVAIWNWTGVNTIEKAEVIISYGDASPWHSWLYRYHYVIPGTIRENAAQAEIPVFEPGTELLAYANITDSNGAVVSTEPIIANPAKLGIDKTNCGWIQLNTAIIKDFSREEMIFAERHGWTLGGKPDTAQKHSGAESLRMEGKTPMSVRLGHVPNHGHRLALWLKSEKPTSIRIEVKAIQPAWNFPLGDTLRSAYGNPADIGRQDAKSKIFACDAIADSEWKEFTIDCPSDGTPAEGYELLVKANDDAAKYWIDSISFTPCWKQN